jgi:hypothetical protein
MPADTLDSTTQEAIERVYDLMDPPLWRVEERMGSGDRTLFLAAVENGAANGSARPLTAAQLYANAPADRRRLLDALYARNAELDREAILAWRTARTPA